MGTVRICSGRASPVRRVVAAVVTLLVTSTVSRAQFDLPQDDTDYTTRGAYLTSRFFQNDAQYRIFQSYQGENRHGLSASGEGHNPFGSNYGGHAQTSPFGQFAERYTGFSRNGNSDRKPIGGYGPGADLRMPIPDYLDWYGGFGRHTAAGRAETVEQAIRRKPSMIASYGLTAPVRRAEKGAAASGGGGYLTPNSAAQYQPKEPAAVSTVALSTQWQGRLNGTALRKLQEAWGLFNSRQYRPASRAFEAVTSLVPASTPARVGEVFCHISLGNFETADVLLLQLASRKKENPFVANVNLADFYSSPQEVDRVRSVMQRLVLGNPTFTAAKSMQAFTFWYLGDRDGAIAAAGTLVTAPDVPASYLDWPEQMVEARRASTQAPQP